MLGDLFPTLLTASGDEDHSATSATALDGLDLGPLLKDPAARLERDALFFHYPHYYPTTTPVSAVRIADWKLLEYFENGRLELYDLSNDASEQTDLAARQPDRASALQKRLDQWRRDIGAQLPTVNATFETPADSGEQVQNPRLKTTK